MLTNLKQHILLKTQQENVLTKNNFIYKQIGRIKKQYPSLSSNQMKNELIESCVPSRGFKRQLNE